MTPDVLGSYWNAQSTARSLGLNWNCSKQSSDQNLLSVLIPNGLISLLNVLSIFLVIASGHSENQKELGSNEGIWQHLFQLSCISPDEKTDIKRVKHLSLTQNLEFMPPHFGFGTLSTPVMAFVMGAVLNGSSWLDSQREAPCIGQLGQELQAGCVIYEDWEESPEPLVNKILSVLLAFL